MPYGRARRTHIEGVPARRLGGSGVGGGGGDCTCTRILPSRTCNRTVGSCGWQAHRPGVLRGGVPFARACAAFVFLCVFVFCAPGLAQGGVARALSLAYVSSKESGGGTLLRRQSSGARGFPTGPAAAVRTADRVGQCGVLPATQRLAESLGLVRSPRGIRKRKSALPRPRCGSTQGGLPAREVSLLADG